MIFHWLPYLLVFLSFFLLSFGPSPHTQTINVRVFSGVNVSSVIVAPSEGNYEILGDGQKIFDLEKHTVISAFIKDGKIVVKTFARQIGQFSKIELKRKQWGASVRIKAVIPSLEERTFHDNFTITVSGNRIRIINHAYIEHYVSGVVESEAGSKQLPEYYKVQSIICRTYALSNLRRHEKEGYYLCDRVHCQVYNGKSRFNPEIPKAAFITKGLVLVDSDIRLITASFHSNCGGQTINSEEVWKYPVSYLKSVCDTFCSGQPHAYWERKIPKENWLNYLQRKFNYPVQDSTYLEFALNYYPDERTQYFPADDTSVNLNRVRIDWKLESTFFSIEQQEDSVLLKGNGFGHGVGLCQEGAMRMANEGIPFNDVLHYYYTSVHLIDLSALDFFREE